MLYNLAKKHRTILTIEQTRYLHNFFYFNSFPTREERMVIAKKLYVPPRTIQIWFQNMRQKVKNKCFKNVKKDQLSKFDALNTLAEKATRILEMKEFEKKTLYYTKKE